MDRVCSISKEQMLQFLKRGLTNRQISVEAGVSHSYVGYLVNKYNLKYLYDKPKYPTFVLNKIESKEMAYTLGFIIADGNIDVNGNVEISITAQDFTLAEFIANVLGVKYREDLYYNKSTRRFPRVRINRKIKGILKFTGGRKKHERTVPIIARYLEVYLLRGIFDADGCVTWGYRKDRNRLWQKVSFTSALGILTAVQKILYKIGISSTVRPKGDEDCFVLEFANKKDVANFYDYLYADTDFIPLRRKFDKYNALRLELGEVRGSTDGVILSEATDLSVERAETTGELNGTLNNQISAQGSKELRYSPTNGGIDAKYNLRTSRSCRFHQSQNGSQCLY